MPPDCKGIKGVYAAALSPRRPGLEQVDLGALWEVFDFLASANVNGIVLMGSTGEFPHFSLEERAHMMRLAVKRSRVPLLINVSHSTLDGAVQLGQAAARAGAQGLLLMPPYFFRYKQPDLLAFFHAFLREAAPGIPVLLYNIPQFTSPLEAGTIMELLRSGYAGIKDSSGDWDLFTELRHQTDPQTGILIGSDGIFSRALAAGANGAVSGIASAVPELLTGICRSVGRNETERTSRLDALLSEFISHFEMLPVPVAIREALTARGLNAGPGAVPVAAERIRGFRDWFGEWLPAVLRECSGA